MPTSSRSRAARATSPPLLSASTNTTDALQRVGHIRKPSKITATLYEADSNTFADEFPDPRTSKRRKLEIRGSRQQTLDGYFRKPDILKPPVKLAAYAPNGPLIETINGARSIVAEHEDSVVPSNGIIEHDPSRDPVSKKQKKTQVLQDMKKREEKRTLRSQDDGPRLKSELATYFTNYEEIIFDAPHEPELLTVDSTIYVTDDASLRAKVDTPSPSKSVKSVKSAKMSPLSNRRGSALTEVLANTSDYLANKMELDLARFSSGMRRDGEDPLADDTFQVSHKRAERKEKQMRNIEKEHAMHEKAQLDRLLDGLLGHDWLRVLGITGVTESEAKKFETKRRYFILEVQALVDKFKQWREEERRQRLEKEAAIAAERDAEVANDGQENDSDDDDDGSEADGGDEAATDISTSNPPSSDLNASASQQLQRETASALRRLGTADKANTKTSSKTRVTSTPMPMPMPMPLFYRPPSPITSFYPSRHLRDAALKKARNSRNQLAFGHPLPDVDEEDFSLPGSYLSEDVLRASARERRRRKRESVAKSGTSATQSAV